MDREQAIETLRANYPDACYEQLREAVDAAIEALKAQDAAGDTISRQAAIDALAKIAREKFNMSDKYNHYLAGLMDGELAIKGLPTSQPVATDTNVGDTISRQSALEKVRTMQAYKLFEDIILVDKAAVQTELMMLPSAQPEVLACGNGELVVQPEPQWIPVSERLPEKGGEYLVSVHHTIGAISVFHPEKDTYVDDVAIMRYYGKFPSTVRAWMPMPEAYKEGGERI